MKKTIALFLTLIFGVLYSQMPKISNVWLNNNENYVGKFNNKDLKLRVLVSKQDPQNDQVYYISGYTLVDNNQTNFSGKLTLQKYKDSKTKAKVFGIYELAEEEKGDKTGIYKGNFVFTILWNKKLQQIDDKQIDFQGNWQNYKKNKTYTTIWSNKSVVKK